jgi:hypothetical protein
LRISKLTIREMQPIMFQDLFAVVSKVEIPIVGVVDHAFDTIDRFLFRIRPFLSVFCHLLE